MKKLLLFAGTLTSVIAPVATVVACDSKQTPTTPSSVPTTPPTNTSNTPTQTDTTTPKTPSNTSSSTTSSNKPTPSNTPSSTPTTTPSNTPSNAAPQFPLAHSIKDVISPYNGVVFANERQLLWETVEWKDANDKTQGVKLISGKNEADLQIIITDSYDGLKDFTMPNIILWSQVAKSFTQQQYVDLKDEITNAHNLVANAIATINTATGDDLLKLAVAVETLFTKYVALATLSWGYDSLNVQHFAYPALRDQMPHGIKVNDEKSMLEYSKIAVQILLNK